VAVGGRADDRPTHAVHIFQGAAGRGVHPLFPAEGSPTLFLSFFRLVSYCTRLSFFCVRRSSFSGALELFFQRCDIIFSFWGVDGARSRPRRAVLPHHVLSQYFFFFSSFTLNDANRACALFLLLQPVCRGVVLLQYERMRI